MKCEQCGAEAVGYLQDRFIVVCQTCVTDYYIERTIVCLCGSTRFFQDFADTNLEETLKGNIVLSIGCDTHHVDVQYTEEQKRALDRLHMAKIRLAHTIIVLNRDGYIGESTSREIAMAKKLHKNIIYKFPVKESST